MHIRFLIRMQWHFTFLGVILVASCLATARPVAACGCAEVIPALGQSEADVVLSEAARADAVFSGQVVGIQDERPSPRSPSQRITFEIAVDATLYLAKQRQRDLQFLVGHANSGVRDAEEHSAARGHPGVDDNAVAAGGKLDRVRQ